MGVITRDRSLLQLIVGCNYSMCAKRLALALVTRVARRRYNSTSSLINVSPAAVEDAASLTITESFISNSEQQQLMKEVELSMGRKKYNFDHWDDVSVLYREVINFHFVNGVHSLYIAVWVICVRGTRGWSKIAHLLKYC